MKLFTLVPPAYAGIMDTIINSQPSEFKIDPNATIADLLTGNYTLGNFKGLSLILLVFVIAGFIFMFNIITAGWEYMQSGGDPKRVAGASTRFLNGFMGLAIVFFAFIIVNIVTTMIGLGSLL